MVAAGLTQEDGPEGLGEAGDGEATDQRQRGDGGECRAGRLVPERDGGRESPRVDQELAYEPVERWKAGDGRRPNQEEHARPRHALEEPAELLDVAGLRAVEHGTGSEEQQRLEECVVQDVEEGASEAEDGQRSEASAKSDQTESEAERDHADVLDAGSREQPFETALRRGGEHAEHARGPPHRNQGPSPPVREWAQEGEGPKGS